MCPVEDSQTILRATDEPRRPGRYTTEAFSISAPAILFWVAIRRRRRIFPLRFWRTRRFAVVLLDAETGEPIVDGLFGYPEGRVHVRATTMGATEICCAGRFRLAIEWSGRVKAWEVWVEHVPGPRRGGLAYPEDVWVERLPGAKRGGLAYPEGEDIPFGRLVSVREILEDRSVVLDSPGIYAWCFDESPVPPEFCEGCVVREGRLLLYIGIADDQSLPERICDKHLVSANVSTLRLSLGCLLREKLGLELRCTSGDNYNWGAGEAKLTEWMADHAFVAWCPHGDPHTLEQGAIARYRPPLNINGNKHHPFCEHLRALRGRCKAEARERRSEGN
jgi:hypothetical protein